MKPKIEIMELFVDDYHDPKKPDQWDGFISINIPSVVPFKKAKQYRGWVSYSSQRSGFYMLSTGTRLPEAIQVLLYTRMREEKSREIAASHGKYKAKDIV